MLRASDELRHPYDDRFYWRESVYFNFADAENSLGGWVYLWVTPNKPMRSGMLVSVYHGLSPAWDATEAAMQQPGHRLQTSDNAWVYCFTKEVPELMEADFDDVQLCGLRLTRVAPLERYRIEFADDVGTSLQLDATFTTPPWDYADGVHETPSWVATNRYHRSWKADGTFTLGEQTYTINTTGDGDHSWGTRDVEEYARHTFKMWSFQTPDGSSSISAIRRDNGLCFGFVNVNGDVQAIEDVQNHARYDELGVQRDIWVEVRDVAGRTVTASMDRMFSAIGHGTPGSLWGYEGVGTYAVEGWGSCTGVVSFFWPASFTGELLHADSSIENP